MLEYTFEEAKDLLSSKLNTAKTSLKNTIEDLEFLRDQITTMEVSKYWAVTLNNQIRHLRKHSRYRTSLQLGRQATKTC